MTRWRVSYLPTGYKPHAILGKQREESSESKIIKKMWDKKNGGYLWKREGKK